MAETQDDSSSESVNEVRTLLGLVGIELAGPDLASVSYTHLTLPTIYSV